MSHKLRPLVLRDRYIVAFPLKPSEDPSIKGRTTAPFQNECGIYYVIDDPPLLGAWLRRLVEQEFDRMRSMIPTELTSELLFIQRPCDVINVECGPIYYE
jgi:hypothetical protein